jgi:hypothetical protein
MSARESTPDALIIGAPKAGTSALHAALAQHPQIYASPVKEPKYYMGWDAPPPSTPDREIRTVIRSGFGDGRTIGRCPLEHRGMPYGLKAHLSISICLVLGAGSLKSCRRRS